MPPAAPKFISAAAIGATSIRVDWQSAAFATNYAVQRQQPDSESAFTTIAPTIVGTSYTDNTTATDTLYDYRLIAQNGNGSSFFSQIAQAISNRSNLTAFRPQSVHAFQDPADSPVYDSFTKKPVREQDEFSSTLGPGIRINLDDDDNSGVADAFESGTEIPRENDLVEVIVDRLPGQGDLLLQRAGALNLYYDHDKETPIPLDANMLYTEPLPFVNDSITVFVEWAAAQHGTNFLSLVDAANFASVDSIRFHTFRSFIIIFGGNGQDPQDSDGDGSIGDAVEGANREGIFDLAQGLYNTGWDVLALNEEVVDADDDVNIPFIEAQNAVQRLVTPEFGGGLSVMGYSQGGGATHDLIEKLHNADGIFTTIFGVFLDAVDHDSVFAENDWPNLTLYLLSFYQTNTMLSGGEIDDEHLQFPGTTVEEINTTDDSGWDSSLDHYTIDDDPQIQQRILLRLNQLLSR